MIHHILTFLLLSTTISYTLASEFNCSPSNDHVDAISGTLVINQTLKSCGFTARDNSSFFAFRTDDLNLRVGDSLILKPKKDGEQEHKFYAPLDVGYVVSGLLEPIIEFKFNQTDNALLSTARFVQNEPVLSINADINNNFVIVPVEIKSIKLNIIKSIADSVHLEVIGAKLEGTTLTHMLINESNITVPLEFEGNNTVRIRTSSVYSKCSGAYKDVSETSHELNGPDASLLKKPYQCVNIFKFNSVEQNAHYEADFKNFIDLVDSDDELILDDGSSDSRYAILKSEANSYAGQLVAFKGKELAVIYNSPRFLSASKIQFKLTVQAKNHGGIVVAPETVLNFPPSTSGGLRYELRPQSQEFASIRVANDFKLLNANLTISSSGKLLTRFLENAKLPPVVASNEKNVPLILEFSAKSFNKLDKSITFKSLRSTCHKTSPGVQGGFSAVGPEKEPCYWTVGSSENLKLKVDYNDLSPNGCLTIQPMFEDKPIFDKCNLSSTDVLPTFDLNQVYVVVKLPSNNTRLDASLSNSQYKAQAILDPTEEVLISSPSYPVSYEWSNKQQVYAINGTGKNYLMTVNDVDIRKGEKLLVNNIQVNSSSFDTIYSNTTVNVTIVRSSASKDFDQHRGFNLTALRFDRVITTDSTSNRTSTPLNVTSILLKISSPGKRGSFGKKIVYNITSADKTFDFLLYDGRSIKSYSMNVTEKLKGLTTSDTLFLTYRASKPNVTLPVLTIDYSFVNNCNSTFDHLCDNFTRCVSKDKLCQGVLYCDDKSDIKRCKAGPTPQPEIREVGLSGFGVFILSVFMVSLGVVSALYGPGLFKTLEDRFRSGQYTTFSSVE